MRAALALIAVVAIADALYLASIWPDWDGLEKGPIPKSKFIIHYEKLRMANAKLPPLRWQPVPLRRIAPIMGKAAIAGEDSRFYEHEGIDTEAIQEAMEKNIEKGRVVYGASTISQQTVKNLFLSSSRDYLRKWHELLLTWSMERNLSKRRILEIYLNVAEFGPGVYGVEAASHYYWKIPASELSYEQAVQLAACLPSPKKHNPRTNTRTFQRRVATIMRHLKSPESQEVSESPSETAPTTANGSAGVLPLVEPAPPTLETTRLEPAPPTLETMPAEPAPPVTIPPVTSPLAAPAPADDVPAPATADPAPGTPTTMQQ